MEQTNCKGCCEAWRRQNTLGSARGRAVLKELSIDAKFFIGVHYKERNLQLNINTYI